MLKANQMRVEETRDIAWYKAKAKEIDSEMDQLIHLAISKPKARWAFSVAHSIQRTALLIVDALANKKSVFP